ncbi:DUF1330 domain-containing protein [Rugamonas sp. CCM 8940]|uniref:DUF1330 domain-containing protein n=1 Tax=Rugamonas sp. CCM 8940 TaxID=2765359 RepID=UPI0018F4B33F|nr:DUF1330 domain-containing protein [Rugamonas sp. CCM 8940]MBJ7312837.1 DUF1330 domain-containing protein [Rugamonas sp. CCM 8940]
MAAYAIGSLTIHNTEWQKEYGEKMPALIQAHGGKLLGRGAAQHLEGAPRLPGTTVLLEFPSIEQARAWQADPLHEALRKLRSGGADFDLQLLAGV